MVAYLLQESAVTGEPFVHMRFPALGDGDGCCQGAKGNMQDFPDLSFYSCRLLLHSEVGRVHIVNPTTGWYVQVFAGQIIYIFNSFGLNLLVCFTGSTVNLGDFVVFY